MHCRPRNLLSAYYLNNVTEISKDYWTTFLAKIRFAISKDYWVTEVDHFACFDTSSRHNNLGTMLMSHPIFFHRSLPRALVTLYDLE